MTTARTAGSVAVCNPWTQVYPGNKSQATCSTPHYNRLVQDAPRILRFRLRMMRYNPGVLHVPSKCQSSADTLSRAPVNSPNYIAVS